MTAERAGGRHIQAAVSFRRGRAYVKALADQPVSDDAYDLDVPATGVFIDDRELRPDVDYLVTPGAQLTFGEDEVHACSHVIRSSACKGLCAQFETGRRGTLPAQVTLRMIRRCCGWSLISLRLVIPVVST